MKAWVLRVDAWMSRRSWQFVLLGTVVVCAITTVLVEVVKQIFYTGQWFVDCAGWLSSLVIGAAIAAPAGPVGDVQYQPTPPAVVARMVELAGVRSGDVVADLGCGDGRMVRRAVQVGGVRGLCVDLDGRVLEVARKLAKRDGVYDRIVFRQEDLFTTDLSGVSVVMLFLYPDLNVRLRPVLASLPRGTRIVSHWHSIAGWKPVQVEKMTAFGRERSIFLYAVP